VFDKKMFKVLAPIPKRDGGHWWMRCGTAHVNKDESINVYLDAIPRDMKFTLRELDEDDLRKRDAYRASQGSGTGGSGGDTARPPDSYAASQGAAQQPVPF
jgi:hypothetical protein